MIYGEADASIVLVQMVDSHDLEGIESEIAEIRKRKVQKFCLIALKVKDWNHDLSPWTVPGLVFGLVRSKWPTAFGRGERR